MRDDGLWRRFLTERARAKEDVIVVEVAFISLITGLAALFVARATERVSGEAQAGEAPASGLEASEPEDPVARGRTERPLPKPRTPKPPPRPIAELLAIIQQQSRGKRARRDAFNELVRSPDPRMPSEVAQLLDGDRYCTYLALNFAARKATAPVKFSELLKKAPSRMKRALLEPEWNREDRCKLLRVAVRMNRSAFEGQLIELLELGGRDRVEAEAIRLLGEVGGVAALAALEKSLRPGLLLPSFGLLGRRGKAAQRAIDAIRLRHSAAVGGLALSDESQEGGQLSVAASGELALAAEPTDPKTPA